MWYFPSKFAFLDISINSVKRGRLEIELFMDVPKTSNNFIQLCIG